MDRYDARKETFEEIEILILWHFFLRKEFKEKVFQKAFTVMKCGMMMSVWGSHVK